MSDFLTTDTSLKHHYKVQISPTKHQHTSRTGAKPLDLQSIELYLKEILDSDKQPYPSLEQVARTLGRDRRTIVKHLPDLCRAIAARYLNQRQAIKFEAIAECCQELRQVVAELYAKGIYPSEARLVELLTRPSFLRYKAVREAFLAARQEVGLEPKSGK